MHKLADRRLKGMSEKLEGCVLDAPNNAGPTMHRIYCSHNQKIFLLKTKTFWETVQEINRNRPNDVHRMIDESLKFGDYIYFKFDADNCIVDFERATNIEDGFIIDGTLVFKSQCVFHPDLDRMCTEHFGVMNVPKGLLDFLSEIPTPNVAIFCYLSFEILDNYRIQPSLFRILEVNGEDQSFVMKTSWFDSTMNSAAFASDDEEDVQLEEDLVKNIGAMTGQAALITGYTSVYLIDQPSVSAVLSKYNPHKHKIGHEAKVDVIYNDVLQCYVVFAIAEQHSHYYLTRYVKLPNQDLRPHFYVDLYAGEMKHGFYKSPHLGYIADPWGYLDIGFAFNTSYMPALSARGRHFYVPIIDRLGARHVTKQLRDLGLVTRFEVASPGDDRTQLRVLDGTIRAVMDLEANVVVYDEEEGLAYSKRFHNVLICLTPGHGYQNGEVLKVKMRRVDDPDSLTPTFEVVDARRTDDRCNYRNGKFYLTARYDAALHCYESRLFGYVPSSDKEKPEKSNVCQEEYPFLITAHRNRNHWYQTPLYRGEFYDHNMPSRTRGY